MSLRIAIVTDIHHGKDAEAKKGACALALLENFAQFVAREKPDLVLELGDRISDEDPDTDLRLQREVSDALAPVRAAAPVYHLCGNHDRDFLSAGQNEAVLGQSLGNETLDCGAWRIVLLRADTLIRRPGGFSCPDRDIDWLAATLAQADRPTLIASHVPVGGQSMTGNYYFQNTPALATYPQAERLRAALHAAKVPLAWIAGHVHWNSLHVADGVAHLTQQSLTESFTTDSRTGLGRACGAYGLMTLGDEQLDWEVFGLDPFRLSLPVARLAQRWYRPLPPLGELPALRDRFERIAAYQGQQDEAVA